MSSDYRLELLPYVRKLSFYYARRLIILSGLPENEVEDLQQDLCLAYWQHSAHYDAGRGKQRSFVRMLLEHEVSNLIAKRTAERRDFRRCISLAYTREVAKITRREDRLASHIDIAHALRKFPLTLRRTAHALRHYSQSEGARQLSISRSTLCRRMDDIRVLLAGAGIHVL